MTFHLSDKSKTKLVLVHPHLREVVEAAIKVTTVDFCVLEGLRTLDRQRELVRAGASTTMNSRHLHGLAVDLGAIVGGKITWHPKVYDQIADAMLGTASKLGIHITWGGSWISFKDLVHFELSKPYYPDNWTVDKASDIIKPKEN